MFFLKKTPDKNKKIDQVVEEIKFLSLFWPRVLTNLSKQLKIEMNDVSRKHEDDQLIMQHSIWSQGSQNNEEENARYISSAPSPARQAKTFRQFTHF